MFYGFSLHLFVSPLALLHAGKECERITLSFVVWIPSKRDRSQCNPKGEFYLTKSMITFIDFLLCNASDHVFRETHDHVTLTSFQSVRGKDSSFSPSGHPFYDLRRVSRRSTTMQLKVVLQ